MSILDFILGPNIEKMKAKGDVEGLIKVIVPRGDLETNQKAIRALGEVGTDQAYAKLIDLLAEPILQYTAEEVLLNAGPKAIDRLTAALKSEDERNWRGVIRLLGKIGDDRVITQLIMLNETCKEDDTRRTIQDTLKRIGEPAIKTLQKMLQNKFQMYKAVPILLNMNDQKSIPLIIDALQGHLKKAELKDRQRIIEFLGDTHDKRVVPILAPLVTDRDVAVRVATIYALGKIDDATATDAIKKALTDKVEPVRNCAARKLQDRQPSASAMDTIGVRFDINKIKSGGYGEACWKTFWRAVDIQLLAGCSLLEGDSKDTPDRENVYCLGFRWNLDGSQADAVRAALDRSEEYNRVAATPRYLDANECAKEPLVAAGEVDRSGKIVGTSYRALPAFLKRSEKPEIADSAPAQPTVYQEKDEALDLDALAYQLERLLVSSRNPEIEAEITAIGERLNKAGGMSMMRQVAMRIQERNPMLGSMLNNAWDGIGYWQS